MVEEYVGIKFTSVRKEGSVRDHRLHELEYRGTELSRAGLLSATEGNISFRLRSYESAFVISGTRCPKTNIPVGCFVQIESYDPNANAARAVGRREPSSEVPLHWGIYSTRPDVGAIFHVHSDVLLNHGQRVGLASTRQEQPYGTHDEFKEVSSIPEYRTASGIIMKGHGLLFLGRDIQQSGMLAVMKHNQAKLAVGSSGSQPKKFY